MVIRPARPEEASECVDLAEAVVGGRRSGALVQTALDREPLLVALDDGRAVGTLAYRTDWFTCTFVKPPRPPGRSIPNVSRAL